MLGDQWGPMSHMQAVHLQIIEVSHDPPQNKQIWILVKTAYELAARPGTGHAHWVHMPQGKLKNSVQSLVCKGSPSLQLHQDRGWEHWPCKNSQVLRLQNNLLELKGEVQVSRRNVCNKREKEGFTEWSDRRMFPGWRLISIANPEGVGQGEATAQGQEKPIARSSEPKEWHKIREQLRKANDSVTGKQCHGSSGCWE